MPCEHITVTNCVLSGRFADGVRVGVGNGVIRHAVFSNLVIHDSGFGIEVTAKYGKGPGGTDVEDLRFENILMQVKRGFEIRLNCVQQTEPSNKTMRGIAFRHISGTVELTSRIWGNGVGSISDISFDDICFDYYGVGQAPYIDAMGMWGRDSSDAAFEVKKASNVRFKDVRLRYLGQGQDGWKHGIALEDAPELLCRDCEWGR